MFPNDPFAGNLDDDARVRTLMELLDKPPDDDGYFYPFSSKDEAIGKFVL